MADGQIDRFEWTFSPGDLFEDDHEIEREAYILRFSKGKISADVNAEKSVQKFSTKFRCGSTPQR